MISFIVFFLIPPVVLRVLLMRRSRVERAARSLLGMVAGAGLPLLVVAGLQWNGWQHRIAGDNTPNPYYWGGVGLCLLAAGVAAYALVRRRRRS